MIATSALLTSEFWLPTSDFSSWPFAPYSIQSVVPSRRGSHVVEELRIGLKFPLVLLESTARFRD
jgi:hypothetical protein